MDSPFGTNSDKMNENYITRVVRMTVQNASWNILTFKQDLKNLRIIFW
jgi:hypothetical protein